MKTSRNRKVPIGILLVAALFMASCSSDDDVAPTPEEPAEEAPAEEEPAEEAPAEEEPAVEEPAVEEVAVCNSSDQSVARIWDELALDAIRRDFPAPTVHARNLFHLSVVMWDAWTLIGSETSPYLETYDEPSEEISSDDVEVAISFAAHRMLSDRYRDSKGGEESLAEFDAALTDLCLKPADVDVEGSAAAFGDHIAVELLETFLDDGAAESNGYKGSYDAVNEPLILSDTGATMDEPNRWQQLRFDDFTTASGEDTEGYLQPYVSPHWGAVTPFALPASGDDELAIDPGAPPLLGTDTDEAFRNGILDVLRTSSKLGAAGAVMIDISPGAIGDNPLGTDNGTGRSINPATGEAYEENIVPEGDFLRVIAEFWADGPASETPPGHWNTLGNAVSDALPELRIEGKGEIVDRLKWDLLMYFAMNGSIHDAAVASWGAKRVYNYVRPVSMIRYLGTIGEIPLEPGLVEVVTARSSAAGERHEHLAGSIGETAVLSWAHGRTAGRDLGDADPVDASLGTVQWILAGDWFPYQAPNFVTPAFPAYVSGHSAFSRAAAEVLTALTGSPYFPGGLGSFTEPAGGLAFEDGPSVEVKLEWATYFDASDQAGQSRIAGGIHVKADDYPGREMGSKIGKMAWTKASSYLN